MRLPIISEAWSKFLLRLAKLLLPLVLELLQKENRNKSLAAIRRMRQQSNQAAISTKSNLKNKRPWNTKNSK